MLDAISKALVMTKMKLNFDTTESGMTEEQAIQLVPHLPLTIRVLMLWYPKFGLDFIKSIMQRVKVMKNLTVFQIFQYEPSTLTLTEGFSLLLDIDT